MHRPVVTHVTKKKVDLGKDGLDQGPFLNQDREPTEVCVSLPQRATTSPCQQCSTRKIAGILDHKDVPDFAALPQFGLHQRRSVVKQVKQCVNAIAVNVAQHVLGCYLEKNGRTLPRGIRAKKMRMTIILELL